MTDHVMLDLETLDTKPSAVVASIGAVKFNTTTNSIIERYSATLHIDEQLILGRTISGGTLRWWFGQDKAVQESTFLQSTTTDPKSALKTLATLCSGCCVWGNGAGFDNTIIHSLADDYGIDPIWPFWTDRCFRTISAIFDPRKQLRGDNTMRHDALADAEQQANWLLRIAAQGGIEL